MGTPAQKLQVERLKYPGLLPREIIIFREWLRLHEKDFTRFDYNVRVGNGTDPGTSFRPEVRRDAILNSMKRLDVLCWKGDRATIIEVKDRAGFSTIGQLVGYAALWQPTITAILDGSRFGTDDDFEAYVRQVRPILSPALLLVTNRLAADMVVPLAAAGITFELVAVTFAELRPTTPS